MHSADPLNLCIFGNAIVRQKTGRLASHMRRLPKKNKLPHPSHCSAPLCGSTQCSAPFPHTVLNCQSPSPTRCGARLPSPGFGARLPASRGGAVAVLARHVAAYDSRCSATGPAGHGSRLLPPCPAANAEPLPISTVGPLPPVNSTCRQVLKLHVTSVCFKCFKYFRGMLHVYHTDVAKVDRDVAYVIMVVHAC
jgi:hypothetical protein